LAHEHKSYLVMVRKLLVPQRYPVQSARLSTSFLVGFTFEPQPLGQLAAW
jgi:hypothetical protein